MTVVFLAAGRRGLRAGFSFMVARRGVAGRVGDRSPPSEVLVVPLRLRSLDILLVLRLRRLIGLGGIPGERTRNAQVNGSNPFAGSTFIKGFRMTAPP